MIDDLRDDDLADDADDLDGQPPDTPPMPAWKKEYVVACKKFGINADLTGRSGEIERVGKKHQLRP